MTVLKPTLPAYSPGRATGYDETAFDYDNDVLQQGARTQLLIEPVTSFPASPAVTDWCVRSDLNALFQCTNATGPVWNQMSIGMFTTAARPAAPPSGYLYFDLTDLAVYRYNGSSYDGAWVAPTLLNSWANLGGAYQVAGYCKDAIGRVRLRGSIHSGSATPATILFTLPTGFRPSAESPYAVTSNSAYGEVRVDTSGNVMIYAGSNALLSLDNVTFDTR